MKPRSYRIGDRRTQREVRRGEHYVELTDGSFIRPSEWNSDGVVVEVTYEFNYKYQHLKQDLGWQVVAIALADEPEPATDATPTVPLPWWRRLLAWFGLGRSRIPQARLLKP